MKGPKTRVQGSHEALVSRVVFERVQELMAAHKTYAPRQATGLYPLSGVAKCGVCGGRVDGQKRGSQNASRIYRCHNYMIGAGCGRDGSRSLASVSARLLEEALIDEIERLQRDSAALDELLAQYVDQAQSKTGLTQAEKKRMEQDLAEAEAAVDRWKRLFEKGRIEDEEYLAEVRPHRERAKQLKEKLVEVAEQVVEVPSKQMLGDFAINFRESWEELEAPERKAVLQKFVQAFKLQIVVFPERRVELRPAL